jgi:hypothetical protein
VASQICVCFFEREACLCGMVESPQFPAIRVVTAFTRGPECGPVHIVAFVAGDARNLGVLEVRAGMALLAGDHRMQAEQGHAGEVVLEEDFVPPTLLAMTVVTAGSLLFTMNIVVKVAANATDVFQLRVRAARMALVASRGPMRTTKREFRRGIVIEGRPLPVDRAVTLGAFEAIASAMRVVGFMTSDAVGR